MYIFVCNINSLCPFIYIFSKFTRRRTIVFINGTQINVNNNNNDNNNNNNNNKNNIKTFIWWLNLLDYNVT